MLGRAAILLLVLALVPSAAAEGFALPEGRMLESSLEPAQAAFRAPIDVKADGSLYVKLLDTPANSAFANGSWLVTLAMERADGSRVELGDRSTDKPTDLVPVREGERVILVAAVQAAPGAKAGDRAILAIAMRAAGAESAGSGATIDEARAVSLVLRDVPAGIGVPPVEMPPEVAPSTPEVPSISTPAPPAPQIAASAPVALGSGWLLAAVALLGLVAGLLLVAVVLLAMLVRDTRAVRKDRTVPPSVPVTTDAPEQEKRIQR